MLRTGYPVLSMHPDTRFSACIRIPGSQHASGYPVLSMHPDTRISACIRIPGRMLRTGNMHAQNTQKVQNRQISCYRKEYVSRRRLELTILVFDVDRSQQRAVPSLEPENRRGTGRSCMYIRMCVCMCVYICISTQRMHVALADPYIFTYVRMCIRMYMYSEPENRLGTGRSCECMSIRTNAKQKDQCLVLMRSFKPHRYMYVYRSAR
jgi:hypothetical protein